MRFLYILGVFCFILTSFGQINDIQANKIADCIYKIEGGAKTKHPYGIKSINTNGNKEKSRQICINTIKNTYIRWNKSGRTNDFYDFLADRYCPMSCDKIGNENWKRNIHKLLDGQLNIQ